MFCLSEIKNIDCSCSKVRLAAPSSLHFTEPAVWCRCETPKKYTEKVKKKKLQNYVQNNPRLTVWNVCDITHDVPLTLLLTAGESNYRFCNKLSLVTLPFPQLRLRCWRFSSCCALPNIKLEDGCCAMLRANVR